MHTAPDRIDLLVVVGLSAAGWMLILWAATSLGGLAARALARRKRRDA